MIFRFLLLAASCAFAGVLSAQFKDLPHEVVYSLGQSIRIHDNKSYQKLRLSSKSTKAVVDHGQEWIYTLAQECIDAGESNGFKKLWEGTLNFHEIAPCFRGLTRLSQNTQLQEAMLKQVHTFEFVSYHTRLPGPYNVLDFLQALNFFLKSFPADIHLNRLVMDCQFFRLALTHDPELLHLKETASLVQWSHLKLADIATCFGFDFNFRLVEQQLLSFLNILISTSAPRLESIGLSDFQIHQRNMQTLLDTVSKLPHLSVLEYTSVCRGLNTKVLSTLLTNRDLFASLKQLRLKSAGTILFIDTIIPFAESLNSLIQDPRFDRSFFRGDLNQMVLHPLPLGSDVKPEDFQLLLNALLDVFHDSDHRLSIAICLHQISQFLQTDSGLGVRRALTRFAREMPTYDLDMYRLDFQHLSLAHLPPMPGRAVNHFYETVALTWMGSSRAHLENLVISDDFYTEMEWIALLDEIQSLPQLKSFTFFSRTPLPLVERLTDRIRNENYFTSLKELQLGGNWEMDEMEVQLEVALAEFALATENLSWLRLRFDLDYVDFFHSLALNEAFEGSLVISSVNILNQVDLNDLYTIGSRSHVQLDQTTTYFELSQTNLVINAFGEFEIFAEEFMGYFKSNPRLFLGLERIHLYDVTMIKATEFLSTLTRFDFSLDYFEITIERDQNYVMRDFLAKLLKSLVKMKSDNVNVSLMSVDASESKEIRQGLQTALLPRKRNVRYNYNEEESSFKITIQK